MLDRAAIAARIPHQGAMCLLDAVVDWSATAISCRAVGQAVPRRPQTAPDTPPIGASNFVTEMVRPATTIL